MVFDGWGRRTTARTRGGGVGVGSLGTEGERGGGRDCGFSGEKLSPAMGGGGGWKGGREGYRGKQSAMEKEGKGWRERGGEKIRGYGLWGEGGKEVQA